MTRTSAHYAHSTIGFPKVILKLYEEDGKIVSGYWTEHGVIMGPWHFSSLYQPGYVGHIEKEIHSFDQMVRSRYSNDTSVQG